MPPKTTTLVDNSTKGSSVRKRACKPKVRTGCLTCKTRRVKCDEEKPDCRRCIVFGVKCDGYNSATKLPKNTAALSYRSSQDSLDLYQPSDAILFETERENSYFRQFQDEIATGRSGSLDTSLWNHLLFQACHDEPFVRMGIVAISALSTSKSKMYSYSQEFIAQHREFALQQYEKAIRMIQESLRASLSQSVETSPRKALIACLLICCFESLSGNYFNTLGHAKSGHELLMNWLGKYPESSRQLDGIVSPASNVIEDDLIQAFARLDHQVVTFFDCRPREVHAELKHFGNGTVGNMPERFSNIEEAQQFFVIIQSRKLHFMHANSQNYMTDPSLDSAEIPGSKYLSHSGNSFLEKRKYTQELARWAAAYEPLFRHLRDSADPRVRLAAHTLSIHHRMDSIVLGSLEEQDFSLFDNRIMEFREVVAMTRGLVEEFYVNAQGGRHQQQYFVADIGLIPVLHTVNLLCWDRGVTRESIVLLRRMACREGVWDSDMMADMDERMMEIHEGGVDDYCTSTKTRIPQLGVATDEILAQVEHDKQKDVMSDEVLRSGYGKVEIAWPEQRRMYG